MTGSQSVAVKARAGAALVSPQAHHRHKRIRFGGIWLILVLPSALVLAIFAFWPVVQVVYLSFFNWNMISPNRMFVGWQNYATLFAQGEVWHLLWQSLLYILLILVGNFVLPVIFAAMTLNIGRRSSSLYQTLLFLPAVIATSVASVIWLWMLLPVGGLVNTVLDGIGLSGKNWLSESALALPTIAVVTSWKFFGFNFLIAIAGLKAVPSEYIEASQIDGAGLFARWRYVVLPSLAPTLVFLGVTTALQALNNAFVPIQIMTQGGPSDSSNNILFAVFEDSFQFFQIGKSSAEAVVLMIALGGLAVWQFRIMDKRFNYAE